LVIKKARLFGASLRLTPFRGFRETSLQAMFSRRESRVIAGYCEDSQPGAEIFWCQDG
jgi:hypothetical protein